MNIFQLSNRTGINLTMLRKLEKLKIDFARLDPENDFVEKLRFHLARNQRMTVAQLLTVIDNPSLLDDLGVLKKRYEVRAREQVAALGGLVSGLAPREATAAIFGASRGDADESLIIAEWLKSVLPPQPVPHAWVAVRLLKPLNEFMRGQNAQLISLALLNVRKLPAFAGWWRRENVGSRPAIKYQHPGQLLDL